MNMRVIQLEKIETEMNWAKNMVSEQKDLNLQDMEIGNIKEDVQIFNIIYLIINILYLNHILKTLNSQFVHRIYQTKLLDLVFYQKHLLLYVLDPLI